MGRPSEDQVAQSLELAALTSAMLDVFTPCGSGAVEWWSDNVRQQRRAAQLCTGCSLLEKCRDVALNNNITDGVWGGLTPADRKRIRRQQRQGNGRLDLGDVAS